MSGHHKWSTIINHRAAVGPPGIDHGFFPHVYLTGERFGNNATRREGKTFLVSDTVTGRVRFVRKEPESDHPVRVFQLPANWGS